MSAFVLGQLTGAHPAWPGAGLIDPSRMAMAGHSAGGAAAIAAMLADSRIRAGLDMDGATARPIPDEGLSRPFLFLGKQSNYTPGSGGAVTTWERDWKRLTGWKRWLLVAGAVHASFTDLALWPIRSASTSAQASPEPGPWTSPAPTSGPSSTSTCAAGRKPCLTSPRHATPRSPSVPRTELAHSTLLSQRSRKSQRRPSCPVSFFTNPIGTRDHSFQATAPKRCIYRENVVCIQIESNLDPRGVPVVCGPPRAATGFASSRGEEVGPG